MWNFFKRRQILKMSKTTALTNDSIFKFNSFFLDKGDEEDFDKVVRLPYMINSTFHLHNLPATTS